MTTRIKLSIILITLILTIVLQIPLVNYHKAQIDRAVTDVEENLSTKALALTKIIEKQFTALHGIAAFINTIGFSSDEHTLLTFMQDMYARVPEAKNIFLSPEGTITYMEPLAGNEEVLGLSFLGDSPLATKESVELTIQSRQIVVDGPRISPQGGYGLIARQSIYKENNFQGFVTIVLDMNKIILIADLENTLKSLPSFAIRNVGEDAWFGNNDTFSADYISIQIPLQNITWEMAATVNPLVIQGIWRNTIILESLGLLSILLIGYLLWSQRRFYLHLGKLVNQRTKELRQANTSLLEKEEELRYHYELLQKRSQELELSEQKYELLAYLDSLTGISNRLHFSEYLHMLISINRGADVNVGIFYFDLNQFKDINDTLGHTVGDQLLASVADRIKNSNLPYQHFARTGGDEFILVFDQLKDEQEAKWLAEKILEQFTRPFKVSEHEITISCSIGITIYPNDGATPEELLKHADLAMYEAKVLGGNQYRFFDENMLAQLLVRAEIEVQLKQAIEENQLLLYYQPIIELQTKAIIGLEALVRWNHPTKGMISPADFIPLAEESGLIYPLTDWILQEACRQHQTWLASGLPPIKISVNFSSLWFFMKHRVEDFLQLLEQFGMNTCCIEIEVTERIALMEEYYPVLEQLRAAGVTISIDDFGVEFSSLGYLKQFPVNKIKIDRSFIHGIGDSAVDETIVKAVIFIAYQLGLEVVAEGVETEEQAQFVLEHGCRYAQGYLYYPPQPVSKLEDILREHSAHNQCVPR